MTSNNFWYCLRLELERETGTPQYGRFLREALKTLFPNRFSSHPPKLPETEFLFVIITENHLRHFRPVAEELKRQKRSFSIVYTNEALFEKYASSWPGISFPIQSWVSQWDYFRAVLFQTALLFSNAFSSSRKKSVIIRFAKPTYLIHQTMRRQLTDASESVAHLIGVPHFSGHARAPRKVVLFKAEAYQANAVLLACQRRKTPSFAIQHGLIGDTDQVSNLAVDHYLVWSDLFKKRLMARQAGCVVQITGSAAYDRVFQEVARSGTPHLEDSSLRILVLPSAGFSHTPLHQVYSLLEAVLHFARNNPSASISIKPHPADHTENARRYLLPHLEACPNLSLLDRFAPLPFDKHHLIAINNSGTGMEACIWGRPMVVFSTSWEEVQVKQYIENGVAEFADTPSAFSDKILKIKDQYAQYQEKCRTFSQEQLAFHGHAAEKIVEVLTC